MQGTKVVSNRRPMTIYFKSWGSQVMIILRRNLWKYVKACFSACSDSGYVASGVNGVHSFFIYSGHQIGTKLAPNRRPMTMHFKSRGSRVMIILRCRSCLKIFKSVLFLLQWFQICSQWSKLFAFLLYICGALIWHRADTLWPFISKVEKPSFDNFAMKLCENP